MEGGGFSRESNFAILSPAFFSFTIVLGSNVGFGGGFLGVVLKKDFTVSIIPSPYMCCFTYFPISGSYFLLNSDCRIILSIDLF